VSSTEIGAEGKAGERERERERESERAREGERERGRGRKKSAEHLRARDELALGFRVRGAPLAAAEGTARFGEAADGSMAREK
jgi:hypothetical protein